MSREVDIDQLKRFYSAIYDLAVQFPHPSADYGSPIEDVLYNIADWIEHIDRAKETDSQIKGLLGDVVEGLNNVGFMYYASFK